MNKTNTLLVAGIILGSIFLVSGIPVSAHVAVKPSTVDTNAFQSFTVGVPVEKDIPTTGIRLVIPAGLQYVTPNVKPGWLISVKKDGDAVTEISWTGGSIPAGQRDDFAFSAKVPNASTTINWVAYQSYKDGTIVAWDKDPVTLKETGGEPYSQTKILSAIQQENPASAQNSPASSSSSVFSILAFVISIIALATVRKNKPTI